MNQKFTPPALSRDEVKKKIETRSYWWHQIEVASGVIRAVIGGGASPLANSSSDNSARSALSSIALMRLVLHQPDGQRRDRLRILEFLALCARHWHCCRVTAEARSNWGK
jgi:hypothetical protein